MIARIPLTTPSVRCGADSIRSMSSDQRPVPAAEQPIPNRRATRSPHYAILAQSKNPSHECTQKKRTTAPHDQYKQPATTDQARDAHLGGATGAAAVFVSTSEGFPTPASAAAFLTVACRCHPGPMTHA